MNLTRWQPFKEIENIFNDFPLSQTSIFGWRSDLPVDVYEEGNNLVAEANIPGIDPEKINLTVEDNHLMLSGSREEEKEQKDKNFYTKEISRTRFERSIPLPYSVNWDKADATYKDGVLKITMPKVKDTTGRKLKIKRQ